MRWDRSVHILQEREHVLCCILSSTTELYRISGYYWCGTPKERQEWIAHPEAQPVTEETPILQNFQFGHITCRDAHWAAGVFQGLPEAPIENRLLDDIIITMATGTEPGLAEGAWGLPQPLAGAPLLASHVRNGRLRQVRITGTRAQRHAFQAEPTPFDSLLRGEGFKEIYARPLWCVTQALQKEYKAEVALRRAWRSGNHLITRWPGSWHLTGPEKVSITNLEGGVCRFQVSPVHQLETISSCAHYTGHAEPIGARQHLIGGQCGARDMVGPLDA